MFEMWQRIVIWFFWISGAIIMFFDGFFIKFLLVGWIGYTVFIGIDIFGYAYKEMDIRKLSDKTRIRKKVI